MQVSMAAVLLPCLESADKGKKGLPEGVIAILLKVLQMLFSQMAEAAAATPAPGGSKRTPGKTTTSAGSAEAHAGAADVERYRWAMATLFKTMHMREARTQLVATTTQLARIDPVLAEVAPLLARMNAYDLTSIDGVDYDTRLAAYREADASLYGRLSLTQAALLAQQTLHEVASDDLAMRAAATHSLNHGLLAAAAKEVADAHASASASAQEVSTAAGGKAKGLRSLVRTLLLPQVQRALHHPEGHVRSQHLELMRLMAAALPSSFPEMQPLLDADAELDFFCNITHLQMHRRVRALKKLHGCIRCVSRCVGGRGRASESTGILGCFLGGGETKDRPATAVSVAPTYRGDTRRRVMHNTSAHNEEGAAAETTDHVGWSAEPRMWWW